ncbi:hypothetical protein [Chryseosolibacter indicus]|uniref:Uncharacterized protein n=1 Tax=Chryseosolibacter indicus TaxID=2782351 RepID=A0ABS5VQ24_9BACT|nr:hypothetical protein [Chryseosolibacter indicus]MBT1703542.1 hypothetical protein [Chryseosolibacter indicus]
MLKIYEAGTKDVAFELRGHSGVFYVNRGLEHGLDLKKLKFELLGREVTIKYPNHWTPIDPRSIHKHISKLESEDKVFFSEY